MASERRLAEIRERLAAATPGPWELYATGRNVIAITKGRMRSGYRREIVHWSGFDCSNIDDPGQVRANAALIAHAPSDLAHLLDEIARLTRELEAARRERSAAKAEAMTAQASLRRAERELEEARERARHRERQRDAAEAEVQRLRRALQAVRECAHLATARRISGEALYTTSEGDSRMDVETRRGLAAEERRALATDTEVSDGE